MFSSKKSNIGLAAVLIALALANFSCEREAVVFGKNTVCDTTTVTYSGTIAPIISTNCLSCHSASNPSAGFSLSNYEQVKPYAQGGILLGVVQHSSGFQAMPKGGNKLATCDINKIMAWVNRGAPNN
jgi:hypothetical protein